MKKLILFSLFVIVASCLQAQVIYSDDFESYSDGDKLTLVADNSFWTTWSGTSGGTEDAAISANQSSSGDLALYISGTINDVVLLLAEQPLTEGRYKISFDLLVESGKFGYYNLLHQFNGSNSIWATQTFYRTTGDASLEGGAPTATAFTYTPGEWSNISYIIDLDDDLVTCYYGANEINSWKFSSGQSGAGSNNSLHAVNFYAWQENGQAGYYVDDIVIERLTKPSIDLNFSAVLTADNKIDMNWNLVTDSSSYVITDNGSNIFTTQDTTWTLEKPYPQEYGFRVGAKIEDGGYIFSNQVDLELEGGKARDFVLFEVATGTWCPNCPGTARAVDQMHEEGLNVGIIEYHEGNDPFEIPEAIARNNYYGVTGFPTTMGDGFLVQEGGASQAADYATFTAAYNNRLERRLLYDVDVLLEQIEGFDFRVKVDVKELFPYFDGSKTLHIALTESDIEYAWLGVPQVDFCLRAMYPSETGSTVDLDIDGAYAQELEFTIPAEVIKRNCELVVFLQDENSKEIIGGKVVKVADAIVAVNEVLSESVDVFPNPCTDYFELQGLQKGTASIQSLNGQTVMNFDILADQQQVDVRSLHTGVYLLNVETDEGLVVKKIIKK